MKIPKILISQTPPSSFEKSPLADIAAQHNFEIVFQPFTVVEKVSLKEFRSNRIDFTEFNGIIFNSRHAIDHFFGLVAEAKVTISEEMKYFCTTETIALYLQKYIVYRKRKIFFGNGTFADLFKTIVKHKELVFFMPYTDKPREEFQALMKNEGLNFKEACISKTIPQDLSSLDFKQFNLIVVYSAKDIRVLDNNTTTSKKSLKIATSGKACSKAAFEAGFNVAVWAPNQAFPSIANAIEEYLSESSKHHSLDKFRLKSIEDIPIASTHAK